MLLHRGAALLGLLLLSACARTPAPAMRARVDLAGGSNPGSYEAKSLQDGCAEDPVGRDSWGVQLSDWSGPKAGLRSLQLVVPSAATGDQFYLGLVFGDFFAGTVHEIETRPSAPMARGHGGVTVKRTTDGAVITVTGMTQDSVAISATIACAKAPAHPGE